MPKNKLFVKETLKGLHREKMTLYGSVAHLGMGYCRKGLKKAQPEAAYPVLTLFIV
ncbi:MAG: hypothetical protein M1434_14790 [Chloroflexi bacterium]|nr:hypothetical protein [Chloroflexota bacterium]MCL5275986.1 hypothetical protein [Chloroflexota bacterium]